ncbi:MAG: hypothetical protein UHI81_02610 [Olegusella sp.]|nr:hypothetical protein [Olegusella sp.]
MDPRLMPILGEAIVTMGQISLAQWLFARRLPLRTHPILRGVLVAGLAVVGTVLFSWYGTVAHPELMGSRQFVTVFLTFSFVLVLCLAAVLFVYDCSPWTALYCCTSGYTMQNLASGLSGFCTLCAQRLNAGLLPLIHTLGFAVAVTAVVYIPCYLLLIRRLSDRGLALVQDRRMLVVFLVVANAVIGFDVINKSLGALDVPFALIASLRVVHGVVCISVLAASFELLYNKRLEGELASQRQLMDEQARQWQLSQATVSAINARSHQMRHQVINLLADSAIGDDSKLLREVSRELDIYDAQAKTGNTALDVILTEKGLICTQKGITLSCIANGTTLGAMVPADIYALFGRALDGAITAVETLSDKGRASIRLDLRERAGVAALRLEFYADGSPYSPADLEAMHAAAARHGGTLSTHMADGVCALNALLAP